MKTLYFIIIIIFIIIFFRLEMNFISLLCVLWFLIFLKEERKNSNSNKRKFVLNPLVRKEKNIWKCDDLRFEIFTVVTIRIALFSVITSCRTIRLRGDVNLKNILLVEVKWSADVLIELHTRNMNDFVPHIIVLVKLNKKTNLRNLCHTHVEKTVIV